MSVHAKESPPVRHDDLIMRGVEGEEYPIGRALFDKTYTFTVYKLDEATIPKAE